VIFKADPSEIPVVELAVTRDALDLVTLRDFAERNLAQRLLTTPGVASVDAVGGASASWWSRSTRCGCAGGGLTVRDVVGAVSSANRDEPGGSVTTGRREVLARTESRFRSADELRELRIPLPGTDGARAAAAGRRPRPGRARSRRGAGAGGGARRAPRAGGRPARRQRRRRARRARAPVTRSSATRHRAARDVARSRTRATSSACSPLQRAPAVKLSVQKQPTANTIEVVDAVQARPRRAARRGRRASNRRRAGPINDQSVYIRDAVSGVTSSAVVGGLLGIAPSPCSSRRGGRRSVIAAEHPGLVMLTLLMMGVGGLTLNLFSLGRASPWARAGGGQRRRDARERHAHAAREGPGREDGRPDAGAPRRGARPADRVRAGARRGQEVTGSIITGTGANLRACCPSCSCRGSRPCSFRELILVITFATLAPWWWP
jgi:multidrug efflux pump subunit AcrB